MNAPRDRFLDAIRAVAVVRVVTWHTYGWAPITWVVAAVPAMFFVSGHLLQTSFERRRPATVIVDRLRRLLVPFWVFGAFAWSVMLAARQLEHTPETAVRLRDVALWIVPVDDPRGSVWEGGWLAQPLWYVRCLFWLLLAAPLLSRAARRAPALVIGGLVAATLALEIVYRRTTWHDTFVPEHLWRLGDLTLYAVFLTLGMWHARAPRVASGRAAIAAVLAVPVAALTALVAHPQDDIVNNSHALHLVVGGGWLAFALALRGPITRVAARAPVARAVHGIGRRSLSIYLWHTAAVITTWHLLARAAPLPRGVHTVLLGAGTAVATSAIVRIVGRVEDVAARRPTRPTSRDVGVRPSPVVVRFASPALGLALFATAAGVLLPATAAHDRPVLAAVAASPGGGPAAPGSRSGAVDTSPRVPSRAPRVAVSGSAEPLPATASVITADTDAGSSGDDDPQDRSTVAAAPGDLQAVVDRWQSTYASAGLRVGVAHAGDTWIGAPFGGDGGGAFDIESITKTVTASAAWSLVDQGVLSLDAPLPTIDALPELAARGLTLRQLLEHRSGLPDYHELEPPEEADENPAVTVVRNALLADAEFAPGIAQDYSSTNYLVVGLVIEARTGQPLDDVLWGRVLEPAGVGSAFGRVGASVLQPGGGAGGLTSDIDGLLRWGEALLHRHQPVGESIWARMTRLSGSTGLGAGAMGMCPCDGGFLWIGHTGGTTALFYDPRDDVMVAVRIANGIWGGYEDAFAELVESLRQAALAR